MVRLGGIKADEAKYHPDKNPGNKEAEEKCMGMIEMLGISHRIAHKPNELSGGQKQRVAIARALVNNPDILLADEPTGALDSKTGRLVMDLFHRLNREQGKTIILITHNSELAQETSRVLTMRDGMLERAPEGGVEHVTG